LQAKLHLCAIYGSQFKSNFMAPLIMRSGDEVRYKIVKRHGRLAPLSAYSGKQDIDLLCQRLRPWYIKHRHTKRLTLVSLAAAGRWAEDVKFLLEAFPNATLSIYLPHGLMCETERLISQRIEVVAVRGRAGNWAKVLVKLAMAQPRPMIVLAGIHRRYLAPFISLVCLLSAPLSAGTMNNLVTGLRFILNRTEESP
jgi:hypothetical protein